MPGNIVVHVNVRQVIEFNMIVTGRAPDGLTIDIGTEINTYLCVTSARQEYRYEEYEYMAHDVPHSIAHVVTMNPDPSSRMPVVCAL